VKKKKNKETKNGGTMFWRGSRDPLGMEVLEGEFGEVWKMHAHLEVLLELIFTSNLEILE
jgi:hypothetical protein